MKYLICILFLSIYFSSFAFSSLIPSRNHNSFRKLVESSTKEDVCSSLKDYKEINKTNLDEYVKEMKFGESSAKDLVVGLLTESSVDGIQDVIGDVAIWLVLLILSILMLISKFIVIIF